MRILHYGISSNMGGIETYLYKLFTHIDKIKFQFDFIDTNIDKPCFYDEFTEMGSKFYKITPRNISIIQNRKDLEELFKKESFDILHCHLNTLSYIEPIKVALRHGCKVIVHSRSAGSSSSNGKINAILTNTLHYINFIKLPRSKIKMVTVSDLAGKWLFGDKAKYKIINNGIDISRYKFNIENREIIRKKMKVQDKYVVGNIGAFLYPKNHEFIIKVFRELLREKPEAVLMLIGTGPLEKNIENIVKDMNLQNKVYFLGRRTDISEILSGMDCFLFPSIYEGFPNALLEAQCSGLPCLISDNITNEVVVTMNCKQLSLNLSEKQWAHEILNLQYYKDRSRGSEFLRDSGYSVEQEIKKIESLYECW